MNIKKGASLSALASRLLRFVIYIVFIGYTVYSAIHAANDTNRIVVIVLAIAAIAGAIYYEVLQFYYEKAVYQLNYSCDPLTAQATYDHLQKIDIAGGYRSRRVIFDVLVSLALYQSDAVLQIIEDNDKIFRGTPDQLLIRNVSVFLAYVEAGNRSGARRAYPEIIKLKKVKIRGKKLAALYNWDELEALHCLMENDARKALTFYQKVNPQYMNNRELSQYCYYYAVCLKQTGNIPEAEKRIAQLDQIAGKLPVKQKAQDILK